MENKKAVFWVILLAGLILLLIEANSYFNYGYFDIEYGILSLTLLLLSICIQRGNNKAIFSTLLCGGAGEFFVGILAMGLPVVGTGYLSRYFIIPMVFSMIMVVVAFWYRAKYIETRRNFLT